MAPNMETEGWIHQATWQNRTDLIDNPTKLARWIIENRDDVAARTEDNKGRLARRLFYKVEPPLGTFEYALLPLFGGLRTEYSPVVAL